MRIYVAFLAILLASAPSCSKQRGTPVSDPEVPLVFEGFSIKPPLGDNWFIATRSSTVVRLAKDTGERFHSALAQADITVFPPGAPPPPPRKVMLDFLAQKLKQSFDKARYRSLKITPSPSTRDDCIANDFSVEDTSPRGKVFLLTGRTAYCVPESSVRFVHLHFSQRVPLGEEPDPIVGEVEPFLRSLKFTPSSPGGVDEKPK